MVRHKQDFCSGLHPRTSNRQQVSNGLPSVALCLRSSLKTETIKTTALLICMCASLPMLYTHFQKIDIYKRNVKTPKSREKGHMNERQLIDLKSDTCIQFLAFLSHFYEFYES